MTDRISLPPFALVSIVAVLGSGCLLKVDELDAGLDDEGADSNDSLDDALDCLVGSESDAVGTERSVFATECEVVCAEGWGHDGDRLDIAWTVSTPPALVGVVTPLALGLQDDGDLTVAFELDGGLHVQHYQPDGVNQGGYEVSGLRATVYGVALTNTGGYVTHGDDDGIVALSNFETAAEQFSWTSEFPSAAASEPEVGPLHVGFLVSADGEAPARDLILVDFEGATEWTATTMDFAGGLAFSPAGDRVAVIGEHLGVHAIQAGALIDEIVHGEPLFGPGGIAFVGDDWLVSVGTSYTATPLQGWLAGNSLTGAGDWEQLYNRASEWCPTPAEDGATGELLTSVTALADGSVIVVGEEGYTREQGGYGANPWVAHITADGEFLSSDRGLWDGWAIDTVAGPDGSAFVLSADLPDPNQPSGFHLRKYLP